MILHRRNSVIGLSSPPRKREASLSLIIYFSLCLSLITFSVYYLSYFFYHSLNISLSSSFFQFLSLSSFLLFLVFLSFLFFWPPSDILPLSAACLCYSLIIIYIYIYIYIYIWLSVCVCSYECVYVCKYIDIQ